jgi:hypothetical protein
MPRRVTVRVENNRRPRLRGGLRLLPRPSGRGPEGRGGRNFRPWKRPEGRGGRNFRPWKRPPSVLFSGLQLAMMIEGPAATGSGPPFPCIFAHWHLRATGAVGGICDGSGSRGGACGPHGLGGKLQVQKSQAEKLDGGPRLPASAPAFSSMPTRRGLLSEPNLPFGPNTPRTRCHRDPSVTVACFVQKLEPGPNRRQVPVPRPKGGIRGPRPGG